MEAKYIIIGGWYLLNGKPIKVEGYLRGNVYYDNGHECGAYELKPVRFNEEILKVNGIDYESEVGIIKKINGNIHISGWMANCELHSGMIRCVHEFQYALRLCGLNELADNFKLKEE